VAQRWWSSMTICANFRTSGFLVCCSAKLAIAAALSLFVSTQPASTASASVTACDRAAVVAGLPMPTLYAGSWSEWITRADRPIATGQ
jgi:3-mercaptopyruvate sulfurtransferase SseA